VGALLRASLLIHEALEGYLVQIAGLLCTNLHETIQPESRANEGMLDQFRFRVKMAGKVRL